MKKSSIKIFITLFILSGLVLSGSVQSRMKCWTNAEDVRECGEKVPPEFAQKSHQELGKGGLIKEKIERAKTDEELAEQRQLDKIQAEKDRILAIQKERDDFLLQTFSTVEDIEKARDERITTLEARIKLTEARNKKIQYELYERIQNAAAAERDGKTPSEALLSDIESLKRQLKNNDIFIKKERVEQEEIKETHAKDIAHFKKLKRSKLSE